MGNRKAILAVVICSALAFAAGAFGSSLAGWHVVATGTDSGDYGADATASSDILKPHSLAIRSSQAADLSWNLLCSSPDNVKAKANVVMSVSVGTAAKCSLTAFANTSTKGTVRVQLLRR